VRWSVTPCQTFPVMVSSFTEPADLFSSHAEGENEELDFGKL